MKKAKPTWADAWAFYADRERDIAEELRVVVSHMSRRQRHLEAGANGDMPELDSSNFKHIRSYLSAEVQTGEEVASKMWPDTKDRELAFLLSWLSAIATRRSESAVETEAYAARDRRGAPKQNRLRNALYPAAPTKRSGAAQTKDAAFYQQVEAFRASSNSSSGVTEALIRWAETRARARHARTTGVQREVGALRAKYYRGRKAVQSK